MRIVPGCEVDGERRVGTMADEHNCRKKYCLEDRVVETKFTIGKNGGNLGYVMEQNDVE